MAEPTRPGPSITETLRAGDTVGGYVLETESGVAAWASCTARGTRRSGASLP